MKCFVRNLSNCVPNVFKCVKFVKVNTTRCVEFTIVSHREPGNYRIYSLIRRTIFYEKIGLFNQNLLKTPGASYNRLSRKKI